MKKSLAVMLALIMVLCMIPTTAFAANMSWTWTVTIFGDNYYRADGTKTTTNKYTINRHLDNSVDHEIGYKFEWNASAGGNNYKGGWQLCLTVDGKIVERSTAYIYEKDMSSASGSWTAPKSSHTGNSSHPFNLYLSNYPARFQNITLTYDANEGSGAPGPETKKVEIGKSATFTVSTMEPTRENYTFKGWSTNKNATTAEYKGGDSITINENTTLYAVWEANTQPETPPEKPKPDNTPAIPGLTELNEVVKVKCKTAPKSHEEKTFGFNWFSCQVGEVIKNNGEYTCTITVLPDEYVTAYNVMHYPGHTLDPDGQKDTLTLKWNATDKQWENTDSAKLPITFTVKCDTVEPTKPDKPGEGVILDLINKINVQCIANTDPKHPEKGYDPIEGSYDVGEVSGDKEKGYTCEITVKPEKYVEKYNADVTGTNHTLAAGEGNKTVTLKYDSANDEWKVDIGMPVVFKVQCDNTQPPLDGNITIEVSKVWEDDIPGAQSITVGLYANGTKVDKKDITPNEGIWYHNFGPRPLEDNNGRDISYTIVEEPIDGYTPHYYTSGEHDKRLVFRVKNVPTEKTGAIKVSKELSGEGAEKDKEFAFTVTLLEYLDSNEVLDGGEPGYYPLSGIYTFGGFEFRDGKVTLGLKGGESVTISGIPAEYDYTVTESNNAGYTVTSENDKGTIRAKGTAEVKFTNTKSAAPTVSPTPTPTPGGGNGGGGHWHPTTTPVPVIVIPPKTGDMTIWQSILHFLGIR